MLSRSQKDYKLCKQHSNWETLSSLVILQTSKSRICFEGFTIQNFLFNFEGKNLTVSFKIALDIWIQRRADTFI